MLENEFLVATAKGFKEIKIHYKLVVLPHNKCQESLCVNSMWNRQGQFPLYLWNDICRTQAQLAATIQKTPTESVPHHWDAK